MAEAPEDQWYLDAVERATKQLIAEWNEEFRHGGEAASFEEDAAEFSENAKRILDSALNADGGEEEAEEELDEEYDN